MDLAALANFGEFIGGIGVILSLIYVAFQIRQNTVSRRTETYARTVERFSGLQHQFAVDPEFNRMYNTGLLDLYALSVNDRIRFVWACTEFFGALEFMHDQYQKENIHLEQWQRWEATARWWMTFPGFRQWWEAKPAPFSAPFSDFIEDCIREGYTEPNPEAWQKLLTTPSPRVAS